MDRPASALRRKSQVFVEIPASPLVSSRSSAANPRVPQENTPLKAVAMNIDHPEPSTSSPTSNKLKRKSMGAPQTEHQGEEGARPPKAKKPKTDARPKADGTTEPSAKGGKKDGAVKNSPSQENTLRCHQCTRQFDPSAIIECTSLRPSGLRCVLKYCKACMRNRYEQDIAVLKANGSAETSADVRSSHSGDMDYLFKCPRCSETCNCRFCRKAKGLPAIGKATKGPTVSEDPSKADTALAGPSSAKAPATSSKKAGKIDGKRAEPSGSKPHSSKPKPHVLIPPSPHAKKSETGDHPSAVEPPKGRLGRPKRVPAPKAIPIPVWTRLPTPLTQNDALQRLNIRECLLRFAHLADIARSHLEELEELGSTTYGPSDSDDDERSEGPSLAEWISEPALRAILVGLLALLSKDSESTSDAASYAKAIHGVKASGVNLTKMWTVLASLREKTSLALPDPLPPPASTQRHGTRSVLQAQDPSSSTITVNSTPQLVPVVSALLEHALQTKTIRDDFERAVSQEKDLVRAARELTAEENARWKASMDAKDTTAADKKAARAAHKAALADIEHAQKVAAVECIPRFAPLGKDADGRVYYALTPGMVEREAAVDLLEGGKGDVRFGRRRGCADESQRSRLRHWSWLLAVWGRKPEGAVVAKRVHEEGDDAEDAGGEDDDEDAEGWWAFWEPAEVAKLAEWLAMKYGIDLEAKRPSKNSEAEEAVAAPAAGAEGEDAEPSAPDARGEEKHTRRARVSAASSVADSSFAGPSRTGVRTFASLNRDSEDEAGGVGVDAGFATNASDEEEEDSEMHDDMYGAGAPTKRDLRALAKGLKEYADLVEWRIKRASREPRDAGDKAEKGDKGKSVPKTGVISTQSFYGK